MKTDVSKINFLDLEHADPIQMGFWVSNRVWATAHFLVPLRKHIAKKKAAGTLTPIIPAVQEFKTWVYENSIYRMWVNVMITQANDFIKSLSAADQQKIVLDGDTIWIEDIDSLFDILNEIVTTSPSFNDTLMVGTPMNGLLAVSMATEAGLALFHDVTFNQKFKGILEAWNHFLKSPDSLDKLDIHNCEKEGSWISNDAWGAGVWDQMVKNVDLPAYGYDSWNAFFIRHFEKDARPFHGTSSDICIGCETTPWQYQDNLSIASNFWIKDADYSLKDLFKDHYQYANYFQGGQAYQGFLSATHYHRWNSPLDGKIVRSWVQPGTYFAQRPGQGENPGTWEGTASQPYLGHVAARAIFIFEHEQCGFVALICIGMVEVSTCVIAKDYLVNKGDKTVTITKGIEIGHFEFGGSTHMMLFQKDKVVLEQWAIDAVSHRDDKNPTAMGSVIASPK